MGGGGGIREGGPRISEGRRFEGGPRGEFRGGREFREGRRFDHDRRRFVRRDGTFFFYGPGYGYDDYYYYSDCDWMRRRALATGAPYWWDRYYSCVNYY
jgi:hypothetical protein